MIQLKIEREAVKKDESSAAEKELVQLDEQIQTIERDYAGLEEIWLAEKAAVQSVTQIKSDIEQAKLDLEVARRAGDLTVMSEIQHGRLPELSKGCRLPQTQINQSRRCSALASPMRKSLRWCRAGQGSR
ncbi:MAG: hypothetical protein CM15mP74_20960 [Halieaceae bacterium]|nr:MAG: hypothetical protein CM15mP74_20960 [Halieaceae bacterium]